jgi:cobalamin biosynthesis protein CobT
MGRRILNRKDLRADFDAAERRKEGEEPEEEEEEGDEDDDEEEGDEEEEEGAAAAEDEEEEEAAGDEDDEEEPKPKKKKKKKVVAPPKEKKTRTRTPKVVRMRVVWGVFNNSHQCVATYEYPRKGEAEQHAARLMADKRSTHFIQPVKEPWEDREKKDDKKDKEK